MALVLTDALQHDLAEVEAGPGLPQHIRDLALKELEALGHFKEMLLRRLVTAVLDSADGLASCWLRVTMPWTPNSFICLPLMG